MKNLLHNKALGRDLESRIYKTIIRRVVIYYRYEVWTIGEVEENMLTIWERKRFRKIYGDNQVENK